MNMLIKLFIIIIQSFNRGINNIVHIMKKVIPQSTGRTVKKSQRIPNMHSLDPVESLNASECSLSLIAEINLDA